MALKFNPITGNFDLVDEFVIDQVNTLAELPDATTLIVPQEYQVTADPTPSNDGKYILEGTTGNAGTGWLQVQGGGASGDVNGGTA